MKKRFTFFVYFAIFISLITCTFWIAKTEVYAQDGGKIIYVSNATTNGNGTKERPYNSIWTAYYMANSGDTICLLSDVVSNSTLGYVDKKITITSDENQTYSITWGSHLEWGIHIVSSGSLTLRNVILDGQNGEPYQSLIHMDGGSLTIEDGAVLRNSKTPWIGGAIHATNEAVITMTGGEISNNEADRGGGLAIHGKSTFVMTGGVIKNNSATDAGAILAFENSKITLSGNASIRNNSSKRNHGGALNVDNSTVEMKENASMTGNQSSAGGGAIFLYDSTFDFQGGVFANNHAVQNGGAIFVHNSTMTMESKASIRENQADIAGGGVYVYAGGKFTMNGGSISKNKALQNGGGIGLVDASEFHGLGGIVEGNETTTGSLDNQMHYGGGIYSYNDSTIELNNIIIERNKAVRGGGIFLANNSTLKMDSGSISYNTATANAGALYIRHDFKPSNATILSGNVDYNECTGEDINQNEDDDINFLGGAVYIGEGSSLSLQSVIITENTLSQEKFLSGRESDRGIFAGGIGLCPDANAYIHTFEGGAIYGNHANGGADILLVTYNKKPVLYTSSFALGGGVYHWTDLEGHYVSGGQLDVDKHFISLKSNLGKDDFEKAKESAKVSISYNKTNAVYGAGGIMCNGILYIGSGEDLSGILVEKKVVGKTNKNQEFSFQVELSDKTINGTYGNMTFKDGIATFTLKENESIMATDLPAGIEYTVTENTMEDYTVSYENEKGTTKEGAISRVVVTNTVVPNTQDSVIRSVITFGISCILLIIVYICNKKRVFSR